MVDSKFKEYAENIVNGSIVSGKAIQLTCKRYLSWFDMDDRYFDQDAAERPIKFISHLRHSTGKFANKPFMLAEWQKFLLYAIYGWKWKSSGKRIIRNVYLQIARKAGKTSLISAIGLYAMIAEGESGAEVDICAPSRSQASIAFSDASNYAQSINKGGFLKILRNGIYFNKNKSIIKIMSPESKLGDGWNTSLGIIDEYAAMDNNNISDLMTSSMGMRENPLMIYLTTAGFNLFGPAKQYRDMCIDILNGNKDDDTILPMIYEMDVDDNYEDSKNWVKANPSLNITVNEEYMYDRIKKAKNNPSELNSILTKNFNMWCSSKSTWLSYDTIIKVCQKIELEQFKGRYCYLSVDLASVSDLSSLTAVINKGEKIVFKTWCFLPEDTISKSVNAFNYNRWIKDGYLVKTPGNVTDFDYIIKKIDEINSICPVQAIYYDSFNATQWAINCTEKGYNMQPYSQTLGSFNRPTKEFERLCLSEKMVIDYNELVLWCFGNVVMKSDFSENIKPVKENAESKIDAVISMVQGLGGLLLDPHFSNDIYIIN